MSIPVSTQTKGALIMVAIVHVMALASAVMMLVWCIYFRGGLSFSSSDKSLIFNLHPVFMLGFIITGGEATIVYRSLVSKKKQIRKLVHAILHILALVFAALGIYTAFKYHIESKITNFYSLHSWLGIVMVFLYSLQLTYGFIVFLYPRGSATLRGEFVEWHVRIGASMFVLAIGTATIGFVEKLTWLQSSGGVGEFSSEALFVNFTALSVLLFGVFVVITAILKPPSPPPSLEVDQFLNVGYLSGYEPLISQC